MLGYVVFVYHRQRVNPRRRDAGGDQIRCRQVAFAALAAAASRSPWQSQLLLGHHHSLTALTPDSSSSCPSSPCSFSRGSPHQVTVGSHTHSFSIRFFFCRFVFGKVSEMNSSPTVPQFLFFFWLYFIFSVCFRIVQAGKVHLCVLK